MWTSQIPLFSMAPALNKNSPYQNFFKMAVKRFYENGQFDIYKQRYTKIKPYCKSMKRKGGPLGLFRLSSLFMMLSLGIVLSCLILICELVFSKQPYKNKDTKILIKRHCSGCDEKQHSSHYCVDCMEYLCYVCYEAH